MSAQRLSNLDLVDRCDSFPYPHQSEYQEVMGRAIQVRVSGYDGVNFGLMVPAIAEKFQRTDPAWVLDADARIITLNAEPNVAARSAAVAKSLGLARDKGVFSVLSKWRNELYAVYGPDGEEVLRFERAATGLLGFVSYGVHMTAYLRTPGPNGPEIKLWVPRRSPTKGTYPNMLDQSVAGGLTAGERHWTCLVRECMEEASLPEEIAKKSIMVGAITYFYISGEGSGGEDGLFQPECEYVYDLDLTEHPDVKLLPNDDEVAEFHLMGIKEVKEALANGEFKPNCGIIILDFMIRHGILTVDEEKNYTEILSRLHRRLDFPMGACLKEDD
jgi:isopentenyldiphosphate isomerase